MKTGPRTYTGEGGGIILLAFQGGEPHVFVTPGEVPEYPAIDFEKAKAAPDGTVFRDGPRWKKHWEEFPSEMAVRDEGARGLPINFQPPHHKALGIIDHKESVAARMLAALHDGDSAYFESLARALESYQAEPQNKRGERRMEHEDIHPARAAGIEAIRQATEQARREPFIEEVKKAYGSTGTNSEFKKNTLIPLGFGWIKPLVKRGRPINPEK